MTNPDQNLLPSLKFRLRKLRIESLQLPPVAMAMLEAVLPLVPLEKLASQHDPDLPLTFFVDEKRLIFKGILPFLAIRLARPECSHVSCTVVSGLESSTLDRIALIDMLLGSGLQHLRNIPADVIGLFWSHLLDDEQTGPILRDVGIRTKADVIRHTGFTRQALFPSKKSKTSVTAGAPALRDASQILRVLSFESGNQKGAAEPEDR